MIKIDVVEEYLKSLKRLDDGERYFESLTDKEYEKIEETKEWNVWLKIKDRCMKLYPLAKERGVTKVKYYD